VDDDGTDCDDDDDDNNNNNRIGKVTRQGTTRNNHIGHCTHTAENGFVHRNNILIYIKQDVTLHSLFYLKTALHVSSGISTHHQERIQLYLQPARPRPTALLPPRSEGKTRGYYYRC